MSLLSSQALITNPTLLARVEAAVRQTAAERIKWEGAAGDLARAAYRDPAAVAPSFMLRLATNGDMAAAACSSCGHVEKVGTQHVDETITWIVGDSWEPIAQDLYGAPADTDPTDPATT